MADHYHPSPLRNYILDFQSPDLENDSKIPTDFLLNKVWMLFPNFENETQRKIQNVFRLVKTSYADGWSFSELHPNDELLKRTYRAKEDKFKRASSAS